MGNHVGGVGGVRKMNRWVHHNKCSGGHAFDEVDGKTYCLGRTDAYFEDEVFISECKKCPRLLKNNEKEIELFCNNPRQGG